MSRAEPRKSSPPLAIGRYLFSLTGWRTFELPTDYSISLAASLLHLWDSEDAANSIALDHGGRRFVFDRYFAAIDVMEGFASDRSRAGIPHWRD